MKCEACDKELPDWMFQVVQGGNLYPMLEPELKAVCMRCQVAHKTCTACDKVYPATEKFFYPKERGRLGLASRCKSCTARKAAEYHDENREKQLSRMRRWRNRRIATK